MATLALEHVMYTTCLQNQQKIKELLSSSNVNEELYKRIINLGKQSVQFEESWKNDANLVPGCQSILFLHSYLEQQRVRLHTYSNALISQGLSQLLVMTYDNELPEVILQCPPTFLEELQIFSLVSPNRANGLANLYLRIKQQAFQYILELERSQLIS